MSKETKRQLDQWVMELAHYLETEHGLEWKVALQKAHLAKTILGLMGTSVVRFSYCKKDGTVREARGTLCRELSKEFAAYEYVQAVEEVVWPRATFTYWDLDREAFRTFSADRLKECNATLCAFRSKKLTGN